MGQTRSTAARATTGWTPVPATTSSPATLARTASTAAPARVIAATAGPTRTSPPTARPRSRSPERPRPDRARKEPTMSASDPAETYERFMVPPLFAPAAEVLLDAVGPTPGDGLLDVGCGTGI